jgi:hypothetical protein
MDDPAGCGLLGGGGVKSSSLSTSMSRNVIQGFGIGLRTGTAGG